MHLQFDNIRIVRFRSFLNEAILHFNDAGSGLYFLKGKNKSSDALGSNGAGKSSIVDSLLWCLYGKTVQGLKNPDIIPWSGKGKTEVSVTILVDKKQHVIKRTVNPNLLTIDGSEADQEYVNKLISIPFEIIPYTIILGQRQPLFFDLTASEKLKLFSEVLNLDRWEQRSVHANELVKSLESEIGVKEAEIKALENAFKQADSDLKSLKLQSAAWEAERADELANAEQRKSALQKQIQSVANERDTADLKLDRAETELKAFTPALDKLQKQERASTITLASLTKDIKQFVEANKELCWQLDALKNDKNCPTCKQLLTSLAIKKQIEKDTNSKINANDSRIAEFRKQIDKENKLQEKAVIAINAQSKAKEQFENDAESARSTLDRLLPKIANWQAEIKAIDRSIAQGAESNNPFTEQMQTLRRRKDQNKAAIEQGQKTVTSKSEYCERARFWVKGFKQIKLLAIEEILQELELITNTMCEESGLVNWQIKYDVERETKQGNIARGINIVVLSPSNKNAVKWEVWSGGEAQRLRLIGTTALSSVLLNHVGVSTNLEIYDEPTVGLSKEGVQDLVEMLAQRAKDNKKNILLIDHHAIESSRFTQTILVTKDSKGSFLQIV